MAANSSEFQKNQANFPAPPRRGKIKAQIVKGMVKSVVSAVTKVGGSLGKFTANGGSRSGSVSASCTPPPSGYNSDV